MAVAAMVGLLIGDCRGRLTERGPIVHQIRSWSPCGWLRARPCHTQKFFAFSCSEDFGASGASGIRTLLPFWEKFSPVTIKNVFPPRSIEACHEIGSRLRPLT